MKQKEIKNLAKKIMQQEKIIQNATSAEERQSAENEIIRLTNSINNFEDMMAIDEAIQDLLLKNS